MASSMRAPVATSLFLTLSAIAMASGESITESGAVRLFIEQSPNARTIPLIQRSVEEEGRAVARPHNPSVAYQVEDAADVRDEFLTFEQPLPVTGRRGLMRRSADAAASAARLAAERDLLVGAVGVRFAFYEVLYRDRELALLREGAARLERIAQILARREREGEGSGYDLLRAEQELSQSETDIARAEGELAAARAEFGAFFDPERRMHGARLDGDFEPSRPLPETEEAIERALANRNDLAALRADRERFEIERRAARRQRFPEPTLAAGWKRTKAPGVHDTGFVAAVTVPLPVFDRGRSVATRAEADRNRAELGAETLRREIRADVQAALAREQAAREVARRHDETMVRRSVELRRIGQLAYDEGESGILELLDAYRTSLEAELRALTARHEAKRAEIDSDRAMGLEVTP
jgi:cobalt-zinc-cadmium efflux system outer membrane protein